MRPHGCPWGPHGISQVGEQRGAGKRAGWWGRVGAGRAGGRGEGQDGGGAPEGMRLGAPCFSGALLALPGPCWAHLATYGLPLALLGFPGLSDNCRDNRQTTAVTMAGQPP